MYWICQHQTGFLSSKKRKKVDRHKKSVLKDYKTSAPKLLPRVRDVMSTRSGNTQERGCDRDPASSILCSIVDWFYLHQHHTLKLLQRSSGASRKKKAGWSAFYLSCLLYFSFLFANFTMDDRSRCVCVCVCVCV